MKNITQHITRITGLLVLSSLLLVSCKKTVVGPKGDPGAQGIQGEPGNANVKSLIISTTCDWKVDSTAHSYTYRIHTADLDNSVLRGGIVMLYYGSQCGCEWKAMPFLAKPLNYSYTTELSTVDIVIAGTDGNLPPEPGVLKFKLVIIPPAD